MNQQQCFNIAYRKQEAEAKEVKDWNPDYRKQGDA